MMSFTTTLSCIDGRTIEPVVAYLKDKYQVQFVDTITEAGICKLLSHCDEKTVIDNIFKRIEVSLYGHYSKQIAVVAHQDCLGNPVAQQTQEEDVQKSLQLLRQKYPDVTLLGLWVDAELNVHEIAQTPSITP